MIPLTNLAREADRYGLGNRPTADIATAVLLDYGVIQPGDLTLAIDPSKEQRARTASRKSSQETFNEEWKEEPLTGLYFDGRKDMTLCYETNEEGKRFPRVKKENHLTLVAEPKSEFWKPGDAAMQSQRKKKQRDNEEKKKESSRIAKFREEKKTDKTVTKKGPNEKQKS